MLFFKENMAVAVVRKTRSNRKRLIDEVIIKRETEMALLWLTHLKNLRSIDDQTQMMFFKENISHL